MKAEIEYKSFLCENDVKIKGRKQRMPDKKQGKTKNYYRTFDAVLKTNTLRFLVGFIFVIFNSKLCFVAHCAAAALVMNAFSILCVMVI